MYLPLEVAIRGLASSESALIATAFLKLFMALPPTLAALAALAVKLGLAWLEDTGKKITGVSHLRFRETARRHRYLKNFCGNQKTPTRNGSFCGSSGDGDVDVDIGDGSSSDICRRRLSTKQRFQVLCSTFKN